MVNILRTLDQRNLLPEIMDDPDLPEAEHLAALRGLAHINVLSGSSRILWSPLRQFLRSSGLNRIRLLDVASGGGDVPLHLGRRLRRVGFAFEVTGTDISPRAVASARCRAAAEESVHFDTLDVLREELPGGFDVVTCSLFLHHLSNEQSRQLLMKMANAAGRLLLVSDLVRSATNVLLVGIAARLLSRSYVVHFDGPQSVRAAFTLAELRELAAEVTSDGDEDGQRRFEGQDFLKYVRTCRDPD